MTEHLKSHPEVAWVNYAGLPEHPDHALVRKYLSGQASGLSSDPVHANGMEPC